MKTTVQGLVPILATPFLPDGALDLPGLRRLTEFQLRAGVHGVSVFGMASEGFALTAEERRRILSEVLTVAGDAVPVVAGVNATSTVTACEQVAEAGAGGASAVMVLPPFLIKPGPDQLLEFYAEVSAEAARHGVEVMVQDAPANTGVPMSVPLLVQLGELDAVTSVKVEAPPTAPKVGALAEAIGPSPQSDGYVILGGQNAQFVLEEYARGAVGTMPAAEFPDLLASVLGEWAAGRHVEARERIAGLLPLILFGLQPGIAWAVHKEVLVLRGVLEHATVRAPARSLDADSRASLHAILASMSLPAVPALCSESGGSR